MDKEEMKCRLRAQKRLTPEIKKIRGEIIDRTIELEIVMDLILTCYFSKSDKINKFLDTFLANEYCSMALKINTLNQNDLITNQFAETLRRISNIRNYVAHAHPRFSSTKTLVEPHLFKSKKQSTASLIQELKTFNQLWKEADEVLMNILIEQISQIKKKK